MGATHEKEDTGEAVAARENLAFLAFALSHAACGDGPVEVRIDERCLIAWCPECAALGAFVST